MTHSRVGRAGLLIAAGTLTSRVLGLGRAMALVYAIGSTGLAANAFATASRVPNTVYTLIAAGALTAVLVPQITKAALATDGGQKYIDKLITLTLVVSALVTLAVAAITPGMIHLLGSGWDDPEQARLATLFAFWLLPQILFYALYTVAGEVLNARSLFGPYAWSPVLNSVISIGGLLTFAALYGSDPDGALSLDRWNTGAVALVAGSATVGVAAQGIVLFAFWKRAGLSFALDFGWRGIGFGAMGKVAMWTFLTVLVNQGVALVHAAVMNLPGPGEPGLATADLANWIFVLPHSIITISLVTANFTRMSESANRGEVDEMKTHLGSVSRLATIAMMFFMFLMSILALPLARIVQPGASYHTLNNVAILLLLGLLCLVPFSLVFVFNRGFFSLSDTRTPFFVTLGQAALMLVAAAGAATLPGDRITMALTLCTSIIFVLHAVATFILLQRRIGPIGGRKLTGTLLQSLGAALLAGGVGWLVLGALGGIGEESFATASFGGAFVTAALVTLAMAPVYLLFLLVFQNRDAQTFMRGLIRRLRRRG